MLGPNYARTSYSTSCQTVSHTCLAWMPGHFEALHSFYKCAGRVGVHNLARPFAAIWSPKAPTQQRDLEVHPSTCLARNRVLKNLNKGRVLPSGCSVKVFSIERAAWLILMGTVFRQQGFQHVGWCCWSHSCQHCQTIHILAPFLYQGLSTRPYISDQLIQHVGGWSLCFGKSGNSVPGHWREYQGHAICRCTCVPPAAAYKS